MRCKKKSLKNVKNPQNPNKSVKYSFFLQQKSLYASPLYFSYHISYFHNVASEGSNLSTCCRNADFVLISRISVLGELELLRGKQAKTLFPPLVKPR